MSASSRKHTVRVRILGEEYSIRSEAAPEHTRAVAEYVDRAIREVMSAGVVIETQRAAILAALQITDELLRSREQLATGEEAMSALAGDIKRLLPPAKREAAFTGEVAE